MAFSLTLCRNINPLTTIIMEEIKNIAPEEVKNENVQSQENAQAVETPETLT